MQNAFIVLTQVVVMVILALTGYGLAKKKFLLPAASGSMTNILIYAVTPAVIINAMQREYDAAQAKAFLLALGLAALSYALCILCAHLLVPAAHSDAGVERFALVMPNAGYIGIPLVQAVLGEDGVFFLTAYLVSFNLLMFSYGRHQLLRDGAARRGGVMPRAFSADSLRRSLINPASISVVAGGALYLTGVALPGPLLTAVQGLAGMNSILSMLLIGLFLSQTDLKSLLHFPRGILLCFLRLCALPLLFMLAIAFIDFTGFTKDAPLVEMAIVIAACTPVSVATSFMGENCGADNLYGAKLIAASTILSIFTMPLMLLLWDFLSTLH